MKLFLSYASAERTTADRLALALEGEGHEVFFDRSDLAAGGAFHRRLREAIQSADAMVVLVTPTAVAPGSYTLAELDIARGRWRRPAGHVLPVLVAPTPVASLPPYLSAVTLLEPRGELVAETVAAVARLDGRVGARGRRLALGAAVGVVLLGAIALVATQVRQRRAVEAALHRDQLAAAKSIQLCNDGAHEPALRQLAELAAHQPLAPTVAALREDCAMHWLREMRATSSDNVKRTLDEQVAVAQPVLLQGLATAHGGRAADLRAHFGWGEQLRRREGTSDADPVLHWQRALADDTGNVYAHAMWGYTLLAGERLAEARRHFVQAVGSGRDRQFVRRLQFRGAWESLEDEETAYAVAVADEMRRGGETLSLARRQQLWNSAFSANLLDADARRALFAAVPPRALRATFDWLFPVGEWRQRNDELGRFNLAILQANAGDHDEALAGFESLDRSLRAQHWRGPLLDETRRALVALRQP